MKGWPGHRIRALLLALLVALGMSLSVVQGGLMAAEMAVAADGAHTGRVAATAVAAAITTTWMPAPAWPCAGLPLMACCLGNCDAAISFSTGLQVARLHLGGQFHSPDHGPPKILILG